MFSGYLIFLSMTLSILDYSANKDIAGITAGGFFVIVTFFYEVVICKKPDFFGEFKQKIAKESPSCHFYNYIALERIAIGVILAMAT